MSFLANFIRGQGRQATQAVTQALVRLDPEAAIQADLDSMRQDLDKAGVVIAKLRADLSNEQKEADAISKRYNELMGAAENLQKQLDDPATDAAKKPSLEQSLSRLVTTIETMAPKLEQEKKDVATTQQLLTEAEAAYKEKAENLTSARANLTRARQEMEQENIREGRAQERAAQAETVAGLRTTSTSHLNTALDTMKKSAEEARQRTEAHNMKAEALKGASESESDPNIEAALAATRGDASKGSLAERLAALKK